MSLDVTLDQNHHGKQIIDFCIERLSSNPSGGNLRVGRPWFNTTTNTAHIYDGTHILNLGATPQIGRYVGHLDASDGEYPTEGNGSGDTILKGDAWVVSVAGSIGNLELHVGDTLFANVDNASLDSDFDVVHGESVDLSPYLRTDNQSNESFTADTEKTFTSTTLSSISDVEIWYTSGGRKKKYTSGVNVEIDANDPTICYVTIGTSLNGVDVVLIGNSVA